MMIKNAKNSKSGKEREDAKGTVNILMIDDNPIDIKSTTRVLKKHNKNYDIDKAVSGAEGLELIGNKSYDVVLLDYKMPKMDGLTVLDEIMERNPDIPVIFITGGGCENVAVTAFKSGAADYIMKTGDYLITLPLVVEKNVKGYRLKREKEKLEEELSNYQLCLSSFDMQNIMVGITEFSKVGAEQVLRNAGRRSGKTFSMNVKAKGLDGEAAIRHLFKIWRSLNWFRAEWPMGSKVEDDIIVRLYDSFESVSAQDTELPNCHFISGLLDALVVELLDEKDGYVQEMKCIARGDEYCEFVISK